jgi:hypothetical protein
MLEFNACPWIAHFSPWMGRTGYVFSCSNKTYSYVPGTGGSIHLPFLNCTLSCFLGFFPPSVCGNIVYVGVQENMKNLQSQGCCDSSSFQPPLRTRSSTTHIPLGKRPAKVWNDQMQKVSMCAASYIIHVLLSCSYLPNELLLSPFTRFGGHCSEHAGIISTFTELVFAVGQCFGN